MQIRTLKLTVWVALMLAPLCAQAEQATIEQPGAHPQYRFEMEPHFVFGYERCCGYHSGAGAGLRVNVPIVKNGFVPSINNNVAIGFGGDLVFHDSRVTLHLPVVMQWNFFFHRQWSAFIEPGLGFSETFNDATFHAFPALSIGGRFTFAERMSVVLRIGYPSINLGLSWFL